MITYAQGCEPWIPAQVSYVAAVLPPLLLVAGAMAFLQGIVVPSSYYSFYHSGIGEVGIVLPFSTPSEAQDRTIYDTQQTTGIAL